MKTSEFDFDLPQELIAQTPLANRSSSRLLVLHRATGEIEHRHFYELVDYLKPGDVLVRILHNECDAGLPLGGGPYYRWETFRDYCKSLYE